MLDLAVVHQRRRAGIITLADWLATAFQADVVAMLQAFTATSSLGS